MRKSSPGNLIGHKILGEDGRLEGGKGGPTVFWWITFALCVVFFVATLLPGAVTLVSWHTERQQAQVSDGLLGVINNPHVFAWTGMLLMCAMVILEQIRRGPITTTANRPGKPAPTGTFQSQVRLLPTPLHLAWFVGLAALSVALLGLPLTVEWDFDIFFVWYLWAAIMVPVNGAVLGSLIKKICYARWYRRQLAASPDGQVVRTKQEFWRWFSYRWRFDLWLCGAASLLIVLGAGLAAALAYIPADDFGDADDILAARGITIVLLSIGVPAMTFGLWACTQYWRSGEEIGSAESVT
ncbi:hypothetical protein [Prauserella cavernicola]|uniref:Uncharacterized protein n=1 Tax=Prauserella cavernicola TaxID=2800127 RepID=A0A934V9D1_9PSEU|nr:hypothetical protein [Prauserella cavernicola]MBK1789220.1 hypothetical protein [Prauserella cavernicola]